MQARPAIRNSLVEMKEDAELLDRLILLSRRRDVHILIPFRRQAP